MIAEFRLVVCQGAQVAAKATNDRSKLQAELGLYIADEYRGKGLGRQALERLTAYARDHIGLRQLYVYIALDNKVCLNLFESFGYRHAGVLQAWVKRGGVYSDVAIMQMILS